MIIPQIAENLTRSGMVPVPEACPVCGGATRVQAQYDVETLYCINEECQAKKLKLFSLFVSRNAMNIDGLSEATLEKFIAKGFIKEFADIFYLSEHREEIVEMEGLGEKSFQNLTTSIETARDTTLPRVLYSLGIPNIGVANAKMICKAYHYDLNKIRTADAEELAAVDGIGPIIGETVAGYFSSEKHKNALERLVKELKIEMPEVNTQAQIFEGKNFVITGSVTHYTNRGEVKTVIEEKGGKVTGSVTSKTDYLINNDAASSSSKNKKAKELGVPIITEEEFIKMLE